MVLTERRTEYSVALFFEDGSPQYLRRWIGAEEAIMTAIQQLCGYSARTGLIRRIIMTDGSERTCWEWKYGEGVTVPKPETP